MSGLDKLRNLRFTTGVEFTNQNVYFLKLPVGAVETIADEIERDMKVASTQMWTQMQGKPTLNDEEEFTDWLERWYLPRPTDKNGDPIKLGDFVSYQGEEPHEVLAMEHHYCGWSLHDGEEEFTDYTESWEIVEPDSIEKLRDEMAWELPFIGEDPKPNYGLADEWLKRAEKLFKEAR